MNRIDIEPDEDGSDLPPPSVVDEGQESRHPSGQDGQHELSQRDRNRRMLTPKVCIAIYLCFFFIETTLVTSQ